MARIVKKRQRDATDETLVIYTRLRRLDVDELRRREKATGAPVAAQIRILVHEGLRARGFVK